MSVARGGCCAGTLRREPFPVNHFDERADIVTTPSTSQFWQPPGWLARALRVLVWHIDRPDVPFETWVAIYQAYRELVSLAPAGTSPPVFEPDPAPLAAVRAILAAPPTSAGAVAITAATRAFDALDHALDQAPS